MHFKIKGPITDQKTIATGSGIKELNRLQKAYGHAGWRKVKGMANIVLTTGQVFTAELHWYEAHGVGKKEFKIKRFLQPGR